MTDHEASRHQQELINAMTSKLCPFLGYLCSTSCAAFDEGKVSPVVIDSDKFTHEVVVKPYCKLIDKKE